MSNEVLEHKHIVIRAEIKKPPRKDDLNYMEVWFKFLIMQLGMKILSGPYMVYSDMKNNRGFTGVCIIETSHVALHVWDEDNPALFELDVYTCSKLDENIVFDMIDTFNPTKIEYALIDREHSVKVIDTGEHPV